MSVVWPARGLMASGGEEQMRVWMEVEGKKEQRWDDKRPRKGCWRAIVARSLRSHARALEIIGTARTYVLQKACRSNRLPRPVATPVAMADFAPFQCLQRAVYSHP